LPRLSSARDVRRSYAAMLQLAGGAAPTLLLLLLLLLLHLSCLRRSCWSDACTADCRAWHAQAAFCVLLLSTGAIAQASSSGSAAPDTGGSAAGSGAGTDASSTVASPSAVQQPSAAAGYSGANNDAASTQQAAAAGGGSTQQAQSSTQSAAGSMADGYSGANSDAASTQQAAAAGGGSTQRAQLSTQSAAGSAGAGGAGARSSADSSGASGSSAAGGGSGGAGAAPATSAALSREQQYYADAATNNRPENAWLQPAPGAPQVRAAVRVGRSCLAGRARGAAKGLHSHTQRHHAASSTPQTCLQVQTSLQHTSLVSITMHGAAQEEAKFLACSTHPWHLLSQLMHPTGGCRTRHLAARPTPLPVRRLRWAAASRATAPPDSRWPRRPCRAHRLPRSRRGPRCGECVQCPGHHRASAWLGASLSLRRSRNRAGASRRTGLPSPGAPRARHLEPRCVAEADNIEVVTRTPIDLVQGTCALSCTASWARGL
jgi:hypothetical protein